MNTLNARTIETSTQQQEASMKRGYIQELSSILTEFQGSIEAMDHAETVYSATFTAEEFRADSVSEEELRDMGYSLHKESINFDDISPCEFDSREEYMRFLINFRPLTLVSPETLICVLVNYKGEGEGYALASECANYPVFISKSDSFMTVQSKWGQE